MVGGDAVATRRFLGNNPPLAFWRTRWQPRYLLYATLLVLPKLTHLAGSAVADIPCLGTNPERVGDAVLESYS